MKGKSALVTGGTRGIGKAIALALAAMGADVAINFFRSRDSAKAAVAEIEAKGVKGLALRANMGNSEQIPGMFAELKNAFGKLDILVSNAALGHFGNVLDLNDKMWDVAMATNAGASLPLPEAARWYRRESGSCADIAGLSTLHQAMRRSASQNGHTAVVHYLACAAFRGINMNAVSAASSTPTR